MEVKKEGGRRMECRMDGRVALILDIPGVITRFQQDGERGVAKPQAA